MVQHSYPLTEKMNVNNSNEKAREISTFYVSNLYTKSPHQDLICVLHKLFFNGGCKTKSDTENNSR